MKKNFLLNLALCAALITACNDKAPMPQPQASVKIPVADVALLLSELEMGNSQLMEVYDAVNSSSYNGYDEEYMMKDLFIAPGSGVGDDRLAQAALLSKANSIKTKSSYDRPLKDLISEHLHSTRSTDGSSGTSRGVTMSPEEYLECLQKSDIQIYWPYSENWDMQEYPVITFDPNDGSTANIGYRMTENPDGTRMVEEVIVDEDYAMEHPVWVVNRNDDSEYTSLEMLRMEDPNWGEGGGGEIIIRPSHAGQPALSMAASAKTRAENEEEPRCRALILRDFIMKRNYDIWFAGASEFFVKTGSVDYFTASTEAEMKLYSPNITDFMVVVKRNQVGKAIPFNALLLSDWTEQLTKCAFLIVEDDGGTRTTWNCSAMVKVNSKSYGFEITFPLNTRDDIVWRGQLAKTFIDRTSGQKSHFGDVDLVFEIVEY